MVEQRQRLAQVTQTITPWLPVMIVPFLLLLMNQVSTIRIDVQAMRNEHVTEHDAHLSTHIDHIGEHTALELRVGHIESTRFTTTDGATIKEVLSMLHKDLALLQAKVGSLRIPPREVEDALMEIKRRLTRLEDYLHRTFSPSEAGP